MEVTVEATILRMRLRPPRAKAPWYVQHDKFTQNFPKFHHQLARPPINLLQAYLTQTSSPSIPASPVQTPAIPEPQCGRPGVSRGIKGYPDGWRQVLNSAKDIVRSSILLKDPFPGPGQARITVNECFHEALTTECRNGLILEPGMLLADGSAYQQSLTHLDQTGFSWSEAMMSVVSILNLSIG